MLTNKQTYNITFSINREHLLFMCVTLYSLLKNNQQYNFNIYVLHNNCLNDKEIKDITNKHPLNQYNNFKIHLVDTSNIEVLKNKEFISFDGGAYGWSREILFKLFLHQVLHNIDKILHLDTDVMVRGDISKLFEIENNSLFKGSCQASCLDCNWLNAGVMLFNLKLSRELEIEKIIIPYLKEHNDTEEVVINHLFKDKIDYLNKKIILHMDKNEIVKEFDNIVAIHYISLYKPFISPRQYFNIKLFLHYHSYLKEFIKNKVRYKLLVYNSFLLNIYYSYKRRIIRLINKTTGKKIENKTTFFTNKIYKYSIIGKK